MATATLRLRTGPDGKQELTIDLESDPDALAHEHEEDHKELADQIIEGGLKGNSKISKKRGGNPQQKAPNRGHEIQERESVGSKV
jgi:hypothetical protein